MANYTIMPTDTFQSLQMDAGVLLKTFNPAKPAAVKDEDIICATTGGFQITAEPEYSDMGEDVDNCPANMKELKHLDSWNVSAEFTSIGTSKEYIRTAFGAADINADTGAITPRTELKQTDFSDVWWAGDRADGGIVAVKIHNALSTSGFSLQTEKSSKGQLSCTLTGHVSLDDQKTVPITAYSIDPSTGA